MSLCLTSPSFGHNTSILAVYTCDGRDISPPLAWSGVPVNTQSLVLIVDDPDAPDPKSPQFTWVHWLLYNIPSSVSKLAEDIGTGALAAGIEEGLNNWQRTGYGGPCPRIGCHRYFFKLYALDTRLSFNSAPTKEQLEAAMQGHVLTKAELIATYHRP